jgi:hypothetical protein
MGEAEQMNRNTQQFQDDRLRQEALERFCTLVESVGVKRFSTSLGVGTRQVNRILSGAQPNPIERLVRCLQSAEPEVGDRVLDYICQEMGGHFVRMEALDQTAVNAVRECAEAIAAISDGHISDLDIREIRDAISALAALSMSIKSQRRNWGGEG